MRRWSDRLRFIMGIPIPVRRRLFSEYIMTSSNGNISELLTLCLGNSPVISECPSQRPVTRSFDVFFDLRLIKRWVNNGEAGDFTRHRTHYDVTIMVPSRRPPLLQIHALSHVLFADVAGVHGVSATQPPSDVPPSYNPTTTDGIYHWRCYLRLLYRLQDTPDGCDKKFWSFLFSWEKLC